MSAKDIAIKKLEAYCKALGVKLIYKKTGSVGTWGNNPPEIAINTEDKENKTKIGLIMTLLHELAHHVYFQHNDKPDIPDAWSLEDEREIGDKPIPKADRKLIYQYEANGIPYMEVIARELDLKIPEHRLKLQIDLDVWVYEFYYEYGHFPSLKETRKKKKQLRNLHKKA